nr:ribbon-helix-helix domain-containing protein [Candidatus Wukongarchaeota archaeon]
MRSSAFRISLKAPKELKKELERLVNQGFYPSKSEAIRVAILSFLKREIPEVPKETETETETEKSIELEELEKELEMKEK